MPKTDKNLAAKSQEEKEEKDEKVSANARRHTEFGIVEDQPLAE